MDVPLGHTVSVRDPGEPIETAEPILRAPDPEYDMRNRPGELLVGAALHFSCRATNDRRREIFIRHQHVAHSGGSGAVLR